MRGNGKSVFCIRRQKQVGLYAFKDASENGDLLPPDARSLSTSRPNGEPPWHEILAKYFNVYPFLPDRGVTVP